ncbi:hypothetical protein AC625_24440 [Peribacillus loiseleuriae]|uniref:Uncharacterized protein n=1 Tax=Peribacillus loiseleuriae TaxID=1679170 RepID=A0A0K9G7T5_9BACI|nr:hypothetical protein AC625_24440 [Peribacillus loiseleuriae]
MVIKLRLLIKHEKFKATFMGSVSDDIKVVSLVVVNPTTSDIILSILTAQTYNFTYFRTLKKFPRRGLLLEPTPPVSLLS